MQLENLITAADVLAVFFLLVWVEHHCTNFSHKNVAEVQTVAGIKDNSNSGLIYQHLAFCYIVLHLCQYRCSCIINDLEYDVAVILPY